MFIHSINEPDSSKEIRNVLMPAQFTPPLGGTLSQLEHHCQTCLRTAVPFRFAVPQTDGGERAFNRIGRANVTPVLGWKIEERQQHIAVFLQAFHRLFVLRFKGPDEQIKSLFRCVLRADGARISGNLQRRG